MDVAEILRIETDGGCALCDAKGPDLLTEHHIDENRENNAYDNRILLCHNCHCRYHQGKGVTTEDIIDRKRQLIAKTLTTYGLNALKIAQRNEFGVVAMPFLLHHLVDLGFLKQEEEQMSYGGGKEHILVNARFMITEEGKRLVLNWFR